MSTSHSMSTGVLVFRGAPKVTPLVAILFAPFNLTAAGIEPAVANLRRIYVTEACGHVWWSALAESLAGYCRALGIPLGRDATPGEILVAVARHYGSGDVPGLIAPIDFDEPVEAADLAMLCRAIPDGNNVDSVRLMGSYRNSRPLLWEAGGWARIDSPRLGVEVRTFSLLNYLDALDRALESEDDLAAAGVVGELVGGLLDGVADPVQALRIRTCLVENLLPKAVRKGSALQTA